jgi:spore maturation protein CgeB
MKLKCLNSTFFDSEANESATYETTLLVDGIEYLYYDYSDYHFEKYM